ncbi:MAG: LysR family transcriptional regulator [Ruminococcaceae bacterium]|nr:LysR family transcriptional regulator [Oscillospiraceae bacterium]
MNISYDHYKVFYYVAKYGSFTQAAEVLFLNQPNLTRTVKLLESELGCTLFVRTNKGVKLTEEGERLFEHISAAIEHIQAGEEEISINKSLERGLVSIGTTEIALRLVLLPILNQFRKKYPKIRIKISNVSTPQALSMLKDGLLDLSVVTTPFDSDPELMANDLYSFKEIAVSGDAYRELSEIETVSLSRIAEYPIISMGTRTSTFEFYTDFFLKNGLSFSPDIEAATADQILPLVEHNLGISFVPESFLVEHSKEKVFRIALNEDIPERSVCLVKKRGRTLSLPARELERMLNEDK